MGSEKKAKKQSNDGEAKTNSLWRKPITLDSFEDDDPLATLYRGREVGGGGLTTEVGTPSAEVKELAKPEAVKPKSSEIKQTIVPAEPSVDPADETQIKKKVEKASSDFNENSEDVKPPILTKMTESELKDVLKIKSDSFHFTDLREILRGRSLDIYAYLRLLSGDTGVCKIKHLDLMKILDISRPTLFKQGEWLMRLFLIEKRNVPGDHLGTSYTVHRLEQILPVSESLLKQFDEHIESFRQRSIAS